MADLPPPETAPEVKLKLKRPTSRTCPSDTPLVKLRAEVVELHRQGRELGLEGVELMEWVNARNPHVVDYQKRYAKMVLEKNAKLAAYIKEHGCPHHATNGEPYLVYFIQERDGREGPIKIGRVTAHPTNGKGALFHVRTRQNSMQSCNPRRLVLLGWTYQHSEREVQEMFAHLRIRGEWFRPSAELLVFIEEVCNDAEA